MLEFYCPVDEIAVLEGAKVILESKCDAGHPMLFHDRHVDQVGRIDERITNRPVADRRLAGGNVKVNFIGGAVTKRG